MQLRETPVLECFSQTFFSCDCAWAFRLLICCWDRDTASSFCWEARSLSWRSATSLSSSMILERSDTVATCGEHSERRREGKEEDWRLEAADPKHLPVFTSLLVGFSGLILRENKQNSDFLSSQFSLMDALHVTSFHPACRHF